MQEGEKLLQCSGTLFYLCCICTAGLLSCFFQRFSCKITWGECEGKCRHQLAKHLALALKHGGFSLFHFLADIGFKMFSCSNNYSLSGEVQKWFEKIPEQSKFVGFHNMPVLADSSSWECIIPFIFHAFMRHLKCAFRDICLLSSSGPNSTKLDHSAPEMCLTAPQGPVAGSTVSRALSPQGTLGQ